MKTPLTYSEEGESRLKCQPTMIRMDHAGLAAS